MAVIPLSAARHIVRPAGFHRIGSRPAVWIDEAGNEVRDVQTVAELAALHVPPAWSHVWADSDPAASLRATGVDTRGRTQYLYSQEATERADDLKFEEALNRSWSLEVYAST